MIPSQAELAARLRSAGCVFAEDEATILTEHAAGDLRRLESLVAARMDGAPLEQLVGWVAFGPLRLSVGPGVFVPRQRSLLLARAALRVVRSQAAPVLLEAYSGVAPIGAYVAHAEPTVDVHAADVDPVALVHARRNLPANAGVHVGDGLGAVPATLRRRITLIAAVPPYIPSGSADLVPREAREHEPGRALFAGADGLDQVRAVVDRAGDLLTAEGRVLLELHRGQYAAAAADARGAGWRTARRPGSDGQTVLLELAIG